MCVHMCGVSIATPEPRVQVPHTWEPRTGAGSRLCGQGRLGEGRCVLGVPAGGGHEAGPSRDRLCVMEVLVMLDVFC